MASIAPPRTFAATGFGGGILTGTGFEGNRPSMLPLRGLPPIMEAASRRWASMGFRVFEAFPLRGRGSMVGPSRVFQGLPLLNTGEPIGRGLIESLRNGARRGLNDASKGTGLRGDGLRASPGPSRGAASANRLLSGTGFRRFAPDLRGFPIRGPSLWGAASGV